MPVVFSFGISTPCEQSQTLFLARRSDSFGSQASLRSHSGKRHSLHVTIERPKRMEPMARS
jgi:hypothetical protein